MRLTLAAPHSPRTVGRLRRIALVGELSLRREKLPVGDSGGQLLVIYHAEPGSASSRALSLLASRVTAGATGPAREHAR